MRTREMEEERRIREDEMMRGEDRGVQEMLLVRDATLPWSRLLTHPPRCNQTPHRVIQDREVMS